MIFIVQPTNHRLLLPNFKSTVNSVSLSLPSSSLISLLRPQRISLKLQIVPIPSFGLPLQEILLLLIMKLFLFLVLISTVSHTHSSRADREPRFGKIFSHLDFFSLLQFGSKYFHSSRGFDQCNFPVHTPSNCKLPL